MLLYYKGQPSSYFISTSGRKSSQGSSGRSNCGRRGSCSSIVATTTKLHIKQCALSGNFGVKYAPDCTISDLILQKFSREGLTEPSPDPSPPILSRDTPSIRASPSNFGRFAPSILPSPSVFLQSSETGHNNS